MHIYVGLDPHPIPPQPATFGKWSSADVVNGGDLRNSANLMTAVEAVTDRTNFIWWRCFDTVSGGTYVTTAKITETNQWVHNGPNQFRSALNYIASTAGGGAKLFIGDATLGVGLIQVNTDGSITWTGAGADATWVNGSTLTMASSAGTATFNNRVNQGTASRMDLLGEVNIGNTSAAGGGAGKVRIGGSDLRIIDRTNFDAAFGATGVQITSWQMRRRRVLSDADHVIAPQSYDIFVVQNPAAHRDITLADGPAGDVVFAMFFKQGSASGWAHAVDFGYASGTGQLVHFSANTDSAWVLYGWGVDLGASSSVEQWIPIASSSWDSSSTLNL